MDAWKPSLGLALLFSSPLLMAQAAPEAPETWGDRTGFTTLFDSEFVAASRVPLGRNDGTFGTYCGFGPLSGAEPIVSAQFQIPDGARLGVFSFWAHDVHPDLDLQLRVFEACQADGAGPPTWTLIGETFTILAIGDYFGFTALDSLNVNNKECAYKVDVRFPVDDAGLCVGGMVSLRKVRVGWTREVSPAPAAATFNDVPTSHPFFQFIEALAKSGITGGCNAAPPLYCPDQPLTRGQMAVFLAKGLGLQWP